MANECQVAILAGGMGTRLAAITGGLPKPMVPVLGKPLLHRQIELCRSYGFTRIALLTHHQHEVISGYFGDGKQYGVSISYAVEAEARGTSGALRDALPMMGDRFLVLYGDTFIDVDLRRMWESHLSSGADATLFLHPNDHPNDSDLVDVNEQGVVREIHPYPHPECRETRNLVNAALYVLNRSGLADVMPIEGKEDIAKHMFPRMLEKGYYLSGYISPEYIKDMGTPERLYKVERDIVKGLPEQLSTRHLRSAIFLDRDGTINREMSHIKSPDQLTLLPGAAAAVRRLNRSGRLTVVITNQPVVARGDVTIDGLNEIHARLDSELGAEGAFLDRLYFCPHHPDKGFPGEVSALKGNCTCRKPETGLIDQACQQLRISRNDSWMIGDTTSDIEVGRRAGLRTILLGTGYAGVDAKFATKPDYLAPSLSEAVEWILDGHHRLSRVLLPIASEVCSGKRLVLVGGKSRFANNYTARVLKELLHVLGRQAHIVCVEGWLKPKADALECSGARELYDLETAASLLVTATKSHERTVLFEPLSDFKGEEALFQHVEHSIGPNDVIIVEGRPALTMPDLVTQPNAVKIYADVASKTQDNDLPENRTWRSVASYDLAWASRNGWLDEIRAINDSKAIADFVIS